MIDKERGSIVPYDRPFDGFHAVPVAVAKTCLVLIEGTRWSVDARAVSRPVVTRVYVDRLECWQDGQIDGQHACDFGRSNTVYDPWHYISVPIRHIRRKLERYHCCVAVHM